MIAIGIDPGVSGGIAAIFEDGIVRCAWRMPETEQDVLARIRMLAPRAHDPQLAQVIAVIEKVHSSPQMGVVSAFTFGRGVGALHMALAASDIPFDEVTPQKWQRAMGCLSRGDKNITKRRAQQLFPKLTITHAIADALLMAEYCRRLHTGVIQHGKEKEVRAQQTSEARDTQAEVSQAHPANGPTPRHGAAQGRTPRRDRGAHLGSAR